MKEQELALNNLILKVRVGSNLYGTNTPESDEDFVGIFVPSTEYLLGLKRIEEVDLGVKSKDSVGKNTSDAVDFKVYSLEKFARLALENNPNILEILFVDIKNILFMNDVGKELLIMRNEFLSKHIKNRFLGYAFAQKHKMIIKLENHDELVEAVKYIDDNQDKQFLLDIEHHPIFVRKKDHVSVGDVNMPITVTTKKAKKMLSARLSKFGSRQELVSKYGYDCYHKDTEFLTLGGWKKFDEVKDNELVGTFNRYNRSLEFQKPYERIKKLNEFGKLYKYNGLYTSFCVTLNHRMYVSNVHRSKFNNFSNKYIESKASWYLNSLNSLLCDNKSHFHIEHTLNNLNKDIDVDDDLLTLLGIVVGDGTFNKFDKSGFPRSVRVSQTDKGKLGLFDFMISIMDKFSFNEYPYAKETVWVSYNKDVVRFIYNSCGHGSLNKRLPKFIYNFSIRQCDLLLKGLFLSDGSDKNNNTLIYHTANKKLANDVQILALLAGREVNLNGPYESISNFNSNLINMYQVSYSKNKANKRYVVLSDRYKSHQRRFGNKPYKVGGKYIDYNDYIVCFSVPNEILITRYNGKIAIQGNTKFASHLIRLLNEGLELLATGTLRFPLQGRQLLRDILAGRLSMQEVLDIADDMEKEVEHLYDTTKLPKQPNRKLVGQFVIETHKKYIMEN